jgi:hypothetical protein
MTVPVAAKKTPLLVLPPAVITTRLPLVTPLGATATILLADQLTIVAEVPLKVTVPVFPPKLVPEMVTCVPEAPLEGLRPVMEGTDTVKFAPLLCNPPLLTTTLPVLALLGTVAVILESDQLVTAALWPLKATVPAEVPKLLPEIATAVPYTPLDGFKLAMVGARTVKLIPLLCRPAAVTVTFPLFAPKGTVTWMDVLDQEE